MLLVWLPKTPYIFAPAKERVTVGIDICGAAFTNRNIQKIYIKIKVKLSLCLTN
jgi:hypothetical protein